MRLPAAALSVLWLVAAGAAAERPPEESYLLHCSACHGPEGRGSEGVVPSLHGLVDLLAAPGGRIYLVRVPGVAQAPMGSAALAEVMNWVLRAYSGGRAFTPYTEAEVEVLRRSPLHDPASARPASVSIAR